MKRVFAITFLLICVATSDVLLNVLSQGTSAAEVLGESIKEMAEQDAKADRPPASVQDLNALFGEQARSAGLSQVSVRQIYQDAYQAARANESWWPTFLPQAGWIAAVVFFVLLIFKDAIKDLLSARTRLLVSWVYNRIAGYKVFQRKALSNYRRALADKYQRFKIPFRSNRFLDMKQIYVPLKVRGATDLVQIDDLEAISRHRRLMVVGGPGSGKSMLLRRLTLSYADNSSKLQPERLIPVLLDLRRLNQGDKSVVDHIVDTLALNRFPRANNFIEISLVRGTLLLLFDGLDEINSSRRAAEVNKLRDFLELYGECRSVITCRTAVYRNEFSDVAEETLEIVEFSDQQIQRFLRSWPGMPENKSVEQLLLSLRERPRIMALARNPLLLTIIAFLYTDMEEFVLPHSRTEFYTQAVDVLLQQLKGQLNRYRMSQKVLVLEQIATFNQEKGAQNKTDRLSLDEKTVLGIINKVLPDLNLTSTDARPLLDEIIERSGLVLEIDNRTRYQFSHLTLQEYFAASAYRSDDQTLLANFKADPDAWRETVKIWCGLPHDSTDLIKQIYMDDPITAFECLADAQRVDQTVADEIVASFVKRFARLEEERNSEAIVSAFAAVASGPSQRSQNVFSFLIKTIASSSTNVQRRAAAEALSLTNKPTAAQVLADNVDNADELVASLVRMGDIATPSLTLRAQQGSIPAVKALYFIGTPAAATSLVPLLWGVGPLADLAALKLGSLLKQESIEMALSAYSVTEKERMEQSHKWVWRPFNAPTDSALEVIAGRICWLIEQHIERTPRLSSREVYETQERIDRRLIIPLVVYYTGKSGIIHSEILQLLPEGQSKALSSYAESAAPNRTIRDAKDKIRAITRAKDKRTAIVLEGTASMQTISPITTKIHRLLAYLDPITRYDLILRLLNDRVPSIDSWLMISHPAEMSLESSWYGRVIRSIIAGLFVLSLIGIAILYREPGNGVWHRAYPLFAGGVLALHICFFLIKLKPDRINLETLLGIPLRRPSLLVDFDGGDKVVERYVALAVKTSILIFRLSYPLIIVISTTSLLFNFLPLTAIVLVWLMVLVSLVMLFLSGDHKERMSGNPLNGILDVPETGFDALDGRPIPVSLSAESQFIYSNPYSIEKD